MNTIFLAMAIQIISSFPDGSLIFCKLSVPPEGVLEKISAQWTGDLGHTAIIFDGFVYEATWPRVKKTALAKWIERYNFKNERSFFILTPKKAFSPNQLDRMKTYAIAQLGERYQARGLWQNRETRGTFCSKYVSEILEQGGIIKSIRFKETPQSLYLEVGDKYNIVVHYTKEKIVWLK